MTTLILRPTFMQEVLSLFMFLTIQYWCRQQQDTISMHNTADTSRQQTTCFCFKFHFLFGSVWSPEKDRRIRFAKSLITLLRIARWCWNLLYWCIMGPGSRRIVKIHFRSNPRWRTAPKF